MMQAQTVKPFFSSFKTFSHAIPGQRSSWLEALRRDDAQYVDQYDLPLFNNEEWKYSSLNVLWQQAYKLVERFEGVIPDEVRALFIDGAKNIVILDGHVVGKTLMGLSDDLAGLALSSGDEAFKKLESDQAYSGAIARNDAKLFVRLNRLYFADLLAVVMPRGCEATGLVHIINVVTASDAAVFPRVLIKLEQGAQLNVLQTYRSLANGEHFNAPVTDIVVEEGARLEYVEKHAYSLSLSCIASVRAWLKKDSSLKAMMLTAGAGLFRSNISVMIEGAGASAEVNGLHHLKGEAHADSHTFLDHQAPNTTSNQLYKCILQDESRSVFNGRVFVHRDAQKTNSYQLNKNLLLSRRCRVDTKPQLEIKADDVKCTHGATISQLDDEQLFYLQTRAVGREDARQMLVRGFIDDVLSKVGHPLIRKVLMKV